jgi:hypothetical protein
MLQPKGPATLVFVYLKDRPTDRPAQRPIFFDVPLPPSVSVSAFVSGSVSVSVLSALGHAFRNHGQLGIIVTMGGRRFE